MPIVPQNIPKPQGNRTEVGVKSLERSAQPSALKKGLRKARSGQAKGDSSTLDRVSREDANLMVGEVAEDPERRRRARTPGGFAEIDAAPGHAASMIRRPGRAFRIDEAGHAIPPHYSEVEQGNLQDAWLLATLAAVAFAQPEALLQRVHQTPDGNFVVELGDHRFGVTPEFPSEGYAEPEPKGQHDTLWVALLEKAFALNAACAYAQLETGNPNRALPLLVEGQSRRQRIRPSGDVAAELAELAAYVTAQKPVVVVSQVSNVRPPLVADHAYALVDVDVAAGTVALYNPWGTRRATRPLDAVRHELAWAEARGALEFLYVGGID